MVHHFLASSTHDGCDACADSVFAALRDARLTLHRQAGHRTCATRSVQRGPAASCEVSGCADLVQEVLVRVAVSLAKRERNTELGPVANHHGYLWTSARTAVIDLGREKASDRGAPARHDAKNGTPGRIITALEALGEHWLVVAFTVVRAEAERGSGSWPWEELAEAKLRSVGDEADVSRRTLAADVNRLVDVVVETAGRKWYHETILIPLAAGQTSSLDVDDDASLAHRRQVEAALAVDPEFDQDVDALFEAFCAQRDLGLKPVPALEAAATQVMDLSVEELRSARRTLRDVAADYEVLYEVRREGRRP